MRKFSTTIKLNKMSKINIEQIINKHTKFTPISDTEYNSYVNYKAAIKEIVEAVVDKCAEKFVINQLESWGHKTGETEIDKDSILKVKQEIDYE